MCVLKPVQGLQNLKTRHIECFLTFVSWPWLLQHSPSTIHDFTEEAPEIRRAPGFLSAVGFPRKSGGLYFNTGGVTLEVKGCLPD